MLAAGHSQELDVSITYAIAPCGGATASDFLTVTNKVKSYKQPITPNGVQPVPLPFYIMANCKLPHSLIKYYNYSCIL